MDNPSIEQAARLLVSARRLLVFTGSGMSKESGIPTFRGGDGIYANMKPEQIATPEAFAADPAGVWRWYRKRLLAHRDAVPNAGHKALASMEALFDTVLVATQNVDGLHERAGSTNVVHLHGTMTHQRCNDCGRRVPLVLPSEQDLPPMCGCGGIRRPDVVWFGEFLPQDAWGEATYFAQNAHAVLAVGSSHLVQPAALLPLAAKDAGARLIEVNPERSQITAAADVHVQETAANALPQIVSRLTALRAGNP